MFSFICWLFTKEWAALSLSPSISQLIPSLRAFVLSIIWWCKFLTKSIVVGIWWPISFRTILHAKHLKSCKTIFTLFTAKIPTLVKFNTNVWEIWVLTGMISQIDFQFIIFQKFKVYTWINVLCCLFGSLRDKYYRKCQ